MKVNLSDTWLRPKIKALTIVACVIIFFFKSCATHNSKMKGIESFRSTLDTHLKAIQERNIEDFEPTIALNVSTIDPNGVKVDGKKEFLDFHRSWFSRRNWERQDSVLTTSETDSMAYAIIQYQYIEKDESGIPQLQFHAYQILVFKNSSNGWQLMYDQNTGIEHLNRSVK